MVVASLRCSGNRIGECGDFVVPAIVLAQDKVDERSKAWKTKRREMFVDPRWNTFVKPAELAMCKQRSFQQPYPCPEVRQLAKTCNVLQLWDVAHVS